MKESERKASAGTASVTSALLDGQQPSDGGRRNSMRPFQNRLIGPIIVTGTLLALFWRTRGGLRIDAGTGNTDLITTQLDFVIANRYWEGAPSSCRMTDPDIGLGYPFETILEPYVEHAFTASVAEGDREDAVFMWTFGDSDMHEGRVVLYTPTLEHGVRTIDVTLNMTNRHDGALLAVVQKKRLALKYVRREIRALVTLDREAFFESMKVLWTLNTGAGQRVYGARYKGIDYFNMKHLSYSSDKGYVRARMCVLACSGLPAHVPLISLGAITTTRVQGSSRSTLLYRLSLNRRFNPSILP